MAQRAFVKAFMHRNKKLKMWRGMQDSNLQRMASKTIALPIELIPYL